MAWERGYYYRVRKINGRVVREYIGKGLAGEQAAASDANHRAARNTQTAARKAEEARHDALDLQVAKFCRGVDLITRAALTAAGFHQHNRGEWRRKRV